MSTYGPKFDAALDHWITGGGDGGWRDAPSGRKWIGQYWDRDDNVYEDVEVELDEGRVIAAWCCGEPASEKLLKELEERYE